MLRDLREFGTQLRGDDGFLDYLDARIYVPDNPDAAELAAAANIAARLAFETLSMDFPIAYPVSAYEHFDGIAVAVGRAAGQVAGSNVIALANPEAIDDLVRSIGIDRYEPTSARAPRTPRSQVLALSSLFAADGLLSPPDGEFLPDCTDTTISLGPDVCSLSVVDLAARLAFESASLRLPLVMVAGERQDAMPATRTFVVGRTHPFADLLIREGRFDLERAPGAGRIAIIDGVVVIAGFDTAGEEAALHYAARRLPCVRDYGKGNYSLADLEEDIRRWRQPAAPPPKVVFQEAFDIPWEVDDARRRIATHLLPAVARGAAVVVDLRLSEPFEVRQSLSKEIARTLQNRGADAERTSVRVLSAHKQGFGWIDEELKPRLSEAAKILISWRELPCDGDSIDCPDRWLRELYPIDEILARDLDIPVDRIAFAKLPSDSPHTYEVVAETADGRRFLHATFDPCSIRRPLFDVFPDYAQARVSTGRLRASINEAVVADERIPTDYERFWDLYQSRILPRIRDYILKLYDGKPRPECSPHFDELSVEATLSEPDSEIGIDQERISTLEALHEDIYFETLLFFDLLGTATCGSPLTYPGRIVPRIHPSRKGPGRVSVKFTGYSCPRAHENTSGSERIAAIDFRNGDPGVAGVEVSADASFCPLLSPAEDPVPRRPEDASAAIQWNEPIGPDECRRAIETLASFPEVRPFPAGRSWLGKPIWAMDVTAPLKGKYSSQAKACLDKRCLFITGRQHANEVSSTSHILKFVELLAADSACRKLLDRVNFVVHPMANPDGAATVEDLHRLTPSFMLHAGYYGALGVDITDRQWADDPVYPEAHVRAKLWRMWLPDVVLNPHGYPSHEWVQLFAGYAAWFRSKRATARDWWIPRGWFMPHFDHIEDERFPHHREAASVLRQRIAEGIGRHLGAINERMYRRYVKYTGTELDLHDGVLFCRPPATSRPDPKSFGFTTRYPEITFFEGLSEAPDEVASGDWLSTLCAAGLEFSLVHARYLAELPRSVTRTRWEEDGRLFLRIERKRSFAV